MLILKVIRTYEWAQGFNREHCLLLVQIGHQSWSEATLTLMLLENSEKSFDWGKQNTPAAIPYKNIIRAIKVLALQEAGVPHAVASRISTSCHLRCKPVGPETSLSPHFTHTLHHVNHTTPSSKDFLLSTYTSTKTAQVMCIYIYICIPNSENSMLETRFLGQCFYMWAALLIESLQKQCLLWNFFVSQNLCWNIP